MRKKEMTQVEIETVQELIDELSGEYTEQAKESLGNDMYRYGETVGARAALTELSKRLGAEIAAEGGRPIKDGLDAAAREEADARAEMEAEAEAERRAERAFEQGRW